MGRTTESSVKPLIGILFLGLIVLWCAGIGVRWYFVRCLRLRDTKTWEALGRPSGFPAGQARDVIAMLKYLFKKDYLKSNDQVVIQAAFLWKWFIIVYACWFGGLVLITIGFLRK